MSFILNERENKEKESWMQLAHKEENVEEEEETVEEAEVEEAEAEEGQEMQVLLQSKEPLSSSNTFVLPLFDFSRLFPTLLHSADS